MHSMRRRSFRHRVHLFAYGFVSFMSIVFGVVFTGFALFERRSLISKVWLAGPTTLAVGLVLCGKVIIDLKPLRQSDDDNETSLDLHSSEKQSPDKQQLMKNVEAKIHFSAEKGKLSSNSLDKQHDPCDCDIWHLRDDSLLDYASACLTTSTYANDDYYYPGTVTKSDRNFQQTQKRSLSQLHSPETNCSLATIGRISSLDTALIYQGETFLFNDRQYLI